MLEGVVVEAFEEARETLGSFLGEPVAPVPFWAGKLGNFAARYNRLTQSITLDEPLNSWKIPKNIARDFEMVYAIAGQEPTQKNVVKGVFVHELGHHEFETQYADKIVVRTEDLAGFKRSGTVEKQKYDMIHAVGEAFATWVADEATGVRTLYREVFNSYRDQGGAAEVMLYFYTRFSNISKTHGKDYVLENLPSIVENELGRAYQVKLDSLKRAYSDFMWEKDKRKDEGKNLDYLTRLLRSISRTVRSFYISK